jgi:hypothetical protein
MARLWLMPERRCDVCGVPYAAQRQTSKYCSTRCRVRASKDPASTLQAARGSAKEALVTSAASVSGLLEAVQAELSQLGQLDTVRSHLALAFGGEIAIAV